jgi:hypothetical protein
MLAKKLAVKQRSGGGSCASLTHPRVKKLLCLLQIAEGGVLPLLHKKFAQPQDIFYIK